MLDTSEIRLVGVIRGTAVDDMVPLIRASVEEHESHGLQAFHCKCGHNHGVCCSGCDRPLIFIKREMFDDIWTAVIRPNCKTVDAPYVIDCSLSTYRHSEIGQVDENDPTCMKVLVKKDKLPLLSPPDGTQGMVCAEIMTAVSQYHSSFHLDLLTLAEATMNRLTGQGLPRDDALKLAIAAVRQAGRVLTRAKNKAVKRFNNLLARGNSVEGALRLILVANGCTAEDANRQVVAALNELKKQKEFGEFIDEGCSEEEALRRIVRIIT